jgi:hypothetical protein
LGNNINGNQGPLFGLNTEVLNLPSLRPIEEEAIRANASITEFLSCSLQSASALLDAHKLLVRSGFGLPWHVSRTRQDSAARRY